MIYKSGRIAKAMDKDGLHIETVFSCIKRTFGREYVYSIKLKNMIQEIMLKASLYNKIISI
jgi:hypothetical protein